MGQVTCKGRKEIISGQLVFSSVRKMVQTRRDKLFERFFLEYIFIRMVMIQFNISVNCANIE